MNKKIIIQIFLIFLIALIFLLFFFKYFKENDTNITKNIVSDKEDFLESSLSNFIDNINYTSTDLRGNKYQITAPVAEIDINQSDIMFLEDVVAYVYLKDSETIKITSNFGKYNSKNYDTIFSKNVIVTYPGHKITGDYMDFSLLNDLGTMSRNVIYTGEKNILYADMVEMEISTKDTKIFMNDNIKKVLIIGTN
jgi:LPS export ABC transporter protein LptC